MPTSAAPTPAPFPGDPQLTDELIRSHHLTPEEYDRAVAALGRAPTYTELGVFSVMWSEHCSYKSSRIHLGRLPTKGPRVIQGPGELLLFNPTTNAVVRSVAVGKQPHWVATGGDGKKAFVTNEGSNDVTIVDLATGKTTTVAVGNAPRKVVVQSGAASAGKGM